MADHEPDYEHSNLSDVPPNGKSGAGLWLMGCAAGLVGGVMAVFLLLGGIWIYIVVWDPKGSGTYGDPFAGLPTFLLLLLIVFVVGSITGSVAGIILLRKRRRERLH